MVLFPVGMDGILRSLEDMSMPLRYVLAKGIMVPSLNTVVIMGSNAKRVLMEKMNHSIILGKLLAGSAGEKCYL